MKQGWEVKRLIEISDVSTGKYDANHSSINGKYRFYTCAYNYGMCDTNRFSGESLILPGNGVNVGSVFYYDGEFDAYQRTYVVNNIKILPKYLHYHMLLYWKELGTKLQYGSATNFIKIGNFQNYDVAYPVLPEQERIVAILDEAFAAIAQAKANAEQNLKNAKELFESYLRAVLSDKQWTRKTLNDVCERVEYGSSTKSKEDGEIAVLRMGNIQNGRLNWDKLVYSNDINDNKKYLLKYNDVLFNRTNSPELVGKTAIYKGEMPSIFAGYLIRIHRNENLLDADYLNYYLNSEMAMEYGKTVVISSVNQANINGTKLKGYPIPCPPLKEQQEIVQKLDALSTETKQLEAIYQQKINDLDELKKSILQKAFAGELNTTSVAA
jgi:type I restriction enzyme S subunit